MPANRRSGRSPTLASFFRAWPKLWRMLREVGVGYTALRVLDRFVPNNLFHARGFFIVAWDLREFPPQREAGLGIRPAWPRDCEALAQFGPPTPELLRRFEHGAHAWIVERDGRPVAYNWVQSGPWHKYDWLVLEKTPNDMFAIEVQVAHGYRRHGFAGLLRRHVASRCMRAGCDRMVGTIESRNRNALAAASKLGYRPIGRVFVLRFLGIGLIGYGRVLRVGRWSARRPHRISLKIFDSPRSVE